MPQGRVPRTYDDPEGYSGKKGYTSKGPYKDRWEALGAHRANVKKRLHALFVKMDLRIADPSKEDLRVLRDSISGIMALAQTHLHIRGVELDMVKMVGELAGHLRLWKIHKDIYDGLLEIMYMLRYSSEPSDDEMKHFEHQMASEGGMQGEVKYWEEQGNVLREDIQRHRGSAPPRHHAPPPGNHMHYPPLVPGHPPHAYPPPAYMPYPPPAYIPHPAPPMHPIPEGWGSVARHGHPPPHHHPKADAANHTRPPPPPPRGGGGAAPEGDDTAMVRMEIAKLITKMHECGKFEYIKVRYTVYNILGSIETLLRTHSIVEGWKGIGLQLADAFFKLNAEFSRDAHCHEALVQVLFILRYGKPGTFEELEEKAQGLVDHFSNTDDAQRIERKKSHSASVRSSFRHLLGVMRANLSDEGRSDFVASIAGVEALLHTMHHWGLPTALAGKTAEELIGHLGMWRQHEDVYRMILQTVFVIRKGFFPTGEQLEAYVRDTGIDKQYRHVRDAPRPAPASPPPLQVVPYSPPAKPPPPAARPAGGASGGGRGGRADHHRVTLDDTTLVRLEIKELLKEVQQDSKNRDAVLHCVAGIETLVRTHLGIEGLRRDGALMLRTIEPYLTRLNGKNAGASIIYPIAQIVYMLRFGKVGTREEIYDYVGRIKSFVHEVEILEADEDGGWLVAGAQKMNHEKDVNQQLLHLLSRMKSSVRGNRESYDIDALKASIAGIEALLKTKHDARSTDYAASQAVLSLSRHINTWKGDPFVLDHLLTVMYMLRYSRPPTDEQLKEYEVRVKENMQDTTDFLYERSRGSRGREQAPAGELAVVKHRGGQPPQVKRMTPYGEGPEDSQQRGSAWGQIPRRILEHRPASSLEVVPYEGSGR